MVQCINVGAKKAVKAFVKQVRQSGVVLDKGEVVTQKLQNGVTLRAHNNSADGMLRIKYETSNLQGATTTDVFEAGVTKGKPKHVYSDIGSQKGGTVMFYPGKKRFLGLFGKSPARVIVDNYHMLGKCKSEYIADLNCNATKARTILHKTGVNADSLTERAIATVEELKKAITAVIENKPL